MQNWIFDLDGVLLSTDRYHYLAWKKMADSIGVYFDETINHRLRGVSRADSLEIILERYDGAPLSQERKEELMEEKNSVYRGFLQEMTPDDVSMDVRDTLRILRERGDRLAVGSSSKNTKLILEKVHLLDAFDQISDGTNITKSKPDPEVFLKAAEYLGVKPEDCTVIEDAEAGIDAAKAGGMRAIGIGEAATYEKTDCAIKNLKELLAL